MKEYLSTILTLVCAVLVVALIVVKHFDNAQHDTDAGSITDFSNRLDSAQIQVATYVGTLLTVSNSLDATSNSLVECRSAVMTFSNQLADAEFTVALDTEQITNLNRQIADSSSENQALSGRVTELTNQVAALTGQIALTQSNLDQANKNYALLENRFRIDVAERVVVERKFNDPWELQAQIQNLKEHPAGAISADDIYAGLDVEVKSNAFHVISPN
jgi:septal ring factor EnvC (AmiA/AmiB activator)